MRVDAGHKPKQQPKPTTADTQGGQRGTQDSPVIVEIHERSKSEEEAAEAQKDKDHTALIEGWTLFFAGAAAVFTGLLVFVGWRAVNAANDTLREISRQANLMEVAYKQSFVPKNWRAQLCAGPNRLRVRVDLQNLTNFPMIIKDGFVSFREHGAGDNHVLGGSIFLPPNTAYTVDVDVFLLDEQVEQFNTTGLFFDVVGAFSHWGPLGDQILTGQPLEGSLGCLPKKTWFTPSVRMKPMPAKREDRNSQKAN